MEITWRDLITVIHGLGFGVLFMLAFSGAIAELYRMSAPGAIAAPLHKDQMMLRIYFVTTVVLAWAAVLSGTYLVYPWYHAIPPAGTTNLAGYPQKLLMSRSNTSSWHSLGMEWKEHVAWIAPITMTMVAYVYTRYRANLAKHRDLRHAVLIFAAAAFVSTAVAGVFGAFLSKYAPVRGGETFQLLKGD